MLHGDDFRALQQANGVSVSYELFWFVQLAIRRPVSSLTLWTGPCGSMVALLNGMSA